ALGEGLTFRSAPLKEEMEITGPSALKLFVSSSTADADVFAVLRVFAPDGREVVFQGALDPHTPVAQGWLRASQRKLDPTLRLTCCCRLFLEVAHDLKESRYARLAGKRTGGTQGSSRYPPPTVQGRGASAGSQRKGRLRRETW